MAGRRGPKKGDAIRIVKKTIEKIVEKIIEKSKDDEGELTVGSGIHEIAIKTYKKKEKKKPKTSQPSRVWVSLEEGGALPVCGGDLDKASTEITEDGFILYLDIKSTERLVKWYVEL